MGGVALLRANPQHAVAAPGAGFHRRGAGRGEGPGGAPQRARGRALPPRARGQVRAFDGSRPGKVPQDSAAHPRRLSRVAPVRLPRPRPRLQKFQDQARGAGDSREPDGAPRTGRRGARGQQGARRDCQARRGERRGDARRRLRLPRLRLQGGRRGRVEIHRPRGGTGARRAGGEVRQGGEGDGPKERGQTGGVAQGRTPRRRRRSRRRARRRRRRPRPRRDRGRVHVAVYRRARSPRRDRLSRGVAHRRRRSRRVPTLRRGGILHHPGTKKRRRERARRVRASRGTRGARGARGRARGGSTGGLDSRAGRRGERERRGGCGGYEGDVPRDDGRGWGRGDARGDGARRRSPRRSSRRARLAHLRRRRGRAWTVHRPRVQVRPQHPHAGVPGARVGVGGWGGERAYGRRGASGASARRRRAAHGGRAAAGQGAQRADAEGSGALPADVLVPRAAASARDAARVRGGRRGDYGEVQRARGEVPDKADQGAGGDAARG